MKLKELKCPQCGANLDVENNHTYCYCQYCGYKIMIDNEKNEYVININNNTNKRYTNDAEVIKAISKEKEDKRAWLALIFLFVFAIALMIIPSFISDVRENTAKSEGKINAGYYLDLIDKDYTTVKAHFEAAGFSNIELIDLDDSGFAFWNNGKVEMISIGGNTNFDSSDYFYPETKVVISYH